jgi:hypothetical protein
MKKIAQQQTYLLLLAYLESTTLSHLPTTTWGNYYLDTSLVTNPGKSPNRHVGEGRVATSEVSRNTTKQTNKAELHSDPIDNPLAAFAPTVLTLLGVWHCLWHFDNRHSSSSQPRCHSPTSKISVPTSQALGRLHESGRMQHPNPKREWLR